MKALETLIVKRMLVDPDTLHQLAATGRPQQLQRRLVQKLQPVLVELLRLPTTQEPALRACICGHRINSPLRSKRFHR